MTGTSLLAKRLAVAFYGMLVLVSAMGVVSALQSLSTESRSTWSSFDSLAHSFLPMTVFMVTALARQLRTAFAWTLLVQVFVTGGLLFGSAMNHAFPEKAVWYALPHVVLALVFTGANLPSLRKQQ